MLIDWFTVVAQIINFLILVLLLRRFLYRPIMSAMAEREAKIAQELQEAAEKQEAAEEEIALYRQKNESFDQQRDDLLRKAETAVAEQRQTWLEQARTDVDETRTRWQKSLVQEKEAFLQSMRRRVGQQTYQVIHRALTDLADVELETRIVQVFLKRLAALPEEEAQSIRKALQEDVPALTLSSAFEIDKTQWRALRQAIFAHFGVGQPIQVKIVPDLICGLELAASGYKVAWSLASYLDELEEGLMNILAGAGSNAVAEGAAEKQNDV